MAPQVWRTLAQNSKNEKCANAFTGLLTILSSLIVLSMMNSVLEDVKIDVHMFLHFVRWAEKHPSLSFSL